MSRGKTRKPKWMHEWCADALARAAARENPCFTRAHWPRAKVGLPNYPTLGGKRPASRRAKKAHCLWLKRLPRTGNGTIQRHTKFMAMSNEERETHDDI